MFTTQRLVKGHPDDARDGIGRRIAPRALETVLAFYVPRPGSPIGELAATFDSVLGKTPQELEDGKLGGGVAVSRIRRPQG